MKSYPSHPRLAVSCCVVRAGAVLLVRRGRPPAEGRWAFPGGTVDLGEPVLAAVGREVMEETGVRIGPPRFAMHHEIIERDDAGWDEQTGGASPRVRWHYVIAAHAADWVAGEPVAADDAAAARFVPFAELAALDVIDTNLVTLRALGHAV